MMPGTSSIDPQPVIDRLCDLGRRVVFFPVRHHSPVCAAIVAELIDRLRPAAVLIEGPSDFAPHMEELYLDHDLPIAIYSYFRDASGNHRGAYYPFCDYSPEWSALQAARRHGVPVTFIDLPWSSVADIDRVAHRYADAELRRGRYVRVLCEKLGADNFDDLWDMLAESRRDLDLAEYLAIAHSLCANIRYWEKEVSQADCRREAFMADQIRSVLEQSAGRLLVVTGGFHSAALAARLEGYPCSGIGQSEEFAADTAAPDDGQEDTQSSPEALDAATKGIALIAYSYERLDSLTGYEAGMPSPGFYDHAWRQRTSGEPFTHRPLLAELARELRARKQTMSTADLIAVDTAAHALAALRGRAHVWRRDLVDAVTSSLIKDELEYGCETPFLDAVHTILRGSRRGRLSAAARLPPLVADIKRQLAAADLEPVRGVRDVEFDLSQPDDRDRSRLLHCLRALDVAGYKRTGGTDFFSDDDHTRLWEAWRVAWSPEFESTCIEAARYGSTLIEAVTARFEEQASRHERSALQAAKLLVAAAQAGIDALSAELLARLSELIAEEPEFAAASAALGHLMFVYFHDEAFGTADLPRIGELLAETFTRSVWLLESLGQTSGQDRALVDAMRVLKEAFERGQHRLGIESDDFAAVLQRVESDADKPPVVRGAAAGILWTIGLTSPEQVLADLRLFASAEHLGDFLTGLFALARETVQRHPHLVRAIDQLLIEFAAEEFQQALPSLRLAFSYFTPREKHYLLGTLLESLGLRDTKPLEKLIVDEHTAAEALTLEDRIFAAIAMYGLESED